MKQVVLADDHPFFLTGLEAFFQQLEGYRVVNSSHNGRAALTAVYEHRPYLLVTDLKMPSFNGIQLCEEVRHNASEVFILVMSSYYDRSLVRKLSNMGVHGFLPKLFGPGELLDALEAIEDGKIYVATEAIAYLEKDMDPELFQDTFIPAHTLTNRQRDIVQLIGKGLTSEAIAQELGLATSTVATHRKTIMSKLALHSAVELANFARKAGLL